MATGGSLTGATVTRTMPVPSPLAVAHDVRKCPLNRLRAVVCVDYREAVQRDRSIDRAADLSYAKTVVLHVGVIEQQQ